MSQSNSQLGIVTWVDLTVADAPAIRDFYEAVVGWTPREVDMGEYADFEMLPPPPPPEPEPPPSTGDAGAGSSEAATTGSAPAAAAPKPAAGICHARGGNAKLPPQWIIYVPVNDLARSLYLCEHLGGRIVHRLSPHYVLIQDPAGAVMMIYQAE